MLAAILGHANLRSISKYVHISKKQIYAGMERFEAGESLPVFAQSVPGKRGKLQVRA
jgi:hypothetical protein